MSNEDGFNPLRWKCHKDGKGCFNVQYRPKIEIFAKCFPRKINFGDGDGKVEINGNLLFLERKAVPMKIPRGQFIMYERITVGRNITTIYAAGAECQNFAQPATLLKPWEGMEVTHLAFHIDGQYIGWKEANLNDLFQEIEKWVSFAEGHDPKWNLHR